MKIRTRFATFLFLSLVLFLMGNLFLLSFFGQKYFAIYQMELSQSLTQANFRALSQAVSVSGDGASGMTLQEYGSLLSDLAQVDAVLQKVEGKLSSQYPISVNPKEQLAQFFTSMRSDHMVETLFLSDSPEAHFVQRLLRDILLANLLFLSVVIVGTFFLFRATLGPLKAASERASVIARTQDYIPIEYAPSDEITPLIASFNRILAELALQNNSRNQVVRDMAHEIATPLMAMKSLMEALSDGILSYSHAIGDQIGDQISKIEYLSRRILSLELADHKQLHREALELRLVVQDFFSQYESLFLKQSQKYEIDIPAEEIVAMDPMDLERILHNIATNFAKYAGHHSTLRIFFKKQSRHWLLSFSDDGTGIDTEHLHKIGTLFYRADISRHTHQDTMSSGLGIALIEKVVSRYKGYARFSSGGVDKGFCVTLYFPR